MSLLSLDRLQTLVANSHLPEMVTTIYSNTNNIWYQLSTLYYLFQPEFNYYWLFHLWEFQNVAQPWWKTHLNHLCGESKTLVKTCRYNLNHDIPSKSLPSWQDAKQQMNFISETITQHEEQCQSIFISLPFILSSGGTMLFNHSCKNPTVINLSVANAPAYQSYVQHLKLNSICQTGI